jgi:hypothetical protein
MRAMYSLAVVLLRTRVVTLAILLLSWSTLSFAGDVNGQRQAKLGELAKYFVQARSLHPGSRPPPPDFNLETLIGSRSNSIRKALGRPDRTDNDYDFGCGAQKCWVYTYGPKSEPFQEIPQDDGSGLSTIVVTTGGPFILILGISSNRIITARWQGQK